MLKILVDWDDSFMHKIDTLEKAARKIFEGRIDFAKELIQAEYPFKILTSVGRNYTDKQKMVQLRKMDLLTVIVAKNY